MLVGKLDLKAGIERIAGTVLVCLGMREAPLMAKFTDLKLRVNHLDEMNHVRSYRV